MIFFGENEIKSGFEILMGRGDRGYIKQETIYIMLFNGSTT